MSPNPVRYRSYRRGHFFKDKKFIRRIIDHQNTGPDELIQWYISTVSRLRTVQGQKIAIDKTVMNLSEEELDFFIEDMGLKLIH